MICGRASKTCEPGLVQEGACPRGGAVLQHGVDLSVVYRVGLTRDEDVDPERDGSSSRRCSNVLSSVVPCAQGIVRPEREREIEVHAFHQDARASSAEREIEIPDLKTGR